MGFANVVAFGLACEELVKKLGTLKGAAGEEFFLYEDDKLHIVKEKDTHSIHVLYKRPDDVVLDVFIGRKDRSIEYTGNFDPVNEHVFQLHRMCVLESDLTLDKITIALRRILGHAQVDIYRDTVTLLKMAASEAFMQKREDSDTEIVRSALAYLNTKGVLPS